MDRIVILTNGKKVANFSSPHHFHFTDGSVLPAVSDSEAERLKVTFIENIDDDGDVTLSFDLSRAIENEMYFWLYAHDHGIVDVVFCPLPMITALNARNIDVKKTPFRAVRMEDRIKKLVSIDKQCL